MTRINPVTFNDIDIGTKEALTAVKAKLGVLPNIFTTFAQSPVTLKAYLELSETLAEGKLSGKERELIAIAVAQENESAYCLGAHAAIGRGEGLNENDISQARQFKAANAKDEAIINFVLQVLPTRGDISDKDLTRFVKFVVMTVSLWK